MLKRARRGHPRRRRRRATPLSATSDAAIFRELLAVVSHDLQNPLAAINVAVQVLEHQHHADAGGQVLLARIRRYSARMGKLIGQLLDFTRARSGGGIPLELQATDLEHVCRAVVDEMELVSGEPGRFALQLRGRLQGRWDPARLAQLVANLLSNADRYGAPGAPVTLSAREEGDDVLLEVSNQGEPIPPELVPFIFEPFRRGRDAAEKQRGLGLGLYISREIALAHGGVLAFRSTSERTTFWLRLPRQLPEG
jgi:signal transduction histidine kinase